MAYKLPSIEQILENRAWRELYEERAAIMEFDGGLSREEAEIEAKKIILLTFKKFVR